MTAHLSTEQLLRQWDGELSQLATRRAARHLQDCSSCQAALSGLKEQMSAIHDAERTVLEPSLPPPPNPWPRLESRLAARTRPESVPFWRRLLPFSSATARAQFSYAGAAAAVLAIIVLAVWTSVTPASAKEILQRVTAADAQRLAITDQQVVRQRVRIQKRIRRTSSQQASRLESWKSPKATYWNLVDDGVNSELLERYKSNGLGAALPLSPSAVESWVAIAGGEPTAAIAGESVAVDIASNAEGRARGLQEVSLHIQRQSWHLDEMTLSFTDAIYQITEEQSAIVARHEVPADVMAFLEPIPKGTRPASHPPLAPAPAGNLDDIEMAVRYELHGIGADLGEAIDISPRSPGELVVNAAQAAPETKERIAALLSNKPGVQLELQPSTPVAAPAGRVTRIAPRTAPTVSDTDQRLITYFGSAEAQENYTRSALESCNNILAHLYALRTLAERWPADQENRLSAESKRRLEKMVADHTVQSSNGALELEKQLQPLMKAFGYAVSDKTAAPPSGANWREAAISGLDAAQRADRILRSVLTTSDEPLSPERGLPQLEQALVDLRRAAQ